MPLKHEDYKGVPGEPTAFQGLQMGGVLNFDVYMRVHIAYS